MPRKIRGRGNAFSRSISSENLLQYKAANSVSAGSPVFSSGDNEITNIDFTIIEDPEIVKNSLNVNTNFNLGRSPSASAMGQLKGVRRNSPTYATAGRNALPDAFADDYPFFQVSGDGPPMDSEFITKTFTTADPSIHFRYKRNWSWDDEMGRIINTFGMQFMRVDILVCDLDTVIAKPEWWDHAISLYADENLVYPTNIGQYNFFIAYRIEICLPIQASESDGTNGTSFQNARFWSSNYNYQAFDDFYIAQIPNKTVNGVQDRFRRSVDQTSDISIDPVDYLDEVPHFFEYPWITATTNEGIEKVFRVHRAKDPIINLTTGDNYWFRQVGEIDPSSTKDARATFYFPVGIEEHDQNYLYIKNVSSRGNKGFFVPSSNSNDSTWVYVNNGIGEITTDVNQIPQWKNSSEIDTVVTRDSINSSNDLNLANNNLGHYPIAKTVRSGAIEFFDNIQSWIDGTYVKGIDFETTLSTIQSEKIFFNANLILQVITYYNYMGGGTTPQIMIAYDLNKTPSIKGSAGFTTNSSFLNHNGTNLGVFSSYNSGSYAVAFKKMVRRTHSATDQVCNEEIDSLYNFESHEHSRIVALGIQTALVPTETGYWSYLRPVFNVYNVIPDLNYHLNYKPTIKNFENSNTDVLNDHSDRFDLPTSVAENVYTNIINFWVTPSFGSMVNARFITSVIDNPVIFWSDNGDGTYLIKKLCKGSIEYAVDYSVSFDPSGVIPDGAFLGTAGTKYIYYEGSAGTNTTDAGDGKIWVLGAAGQYDSSQEAGRFVRSISFSVYEGENINSYNSYADENYVGNYNLASLPLLHYKDSTEFNKEALTTRFGGFSDSLSFTSTDPNNIEFSGYPFAYIQHQIPTVDERASLADTDSDFKSTDILEFDFISHSDQLQGLSSGTVKSYNNINVEYTVATWFVHNNVNEKSHAGFTFICSSGFENKERVTSRTDGGNYYDNEVLASTYNLSGFEIARPDLGPPEHPSLVSQNNSQCPLSSYQADWGVENPMNITLETSTLREWVPTGIKFNSTKYVNNNRSIGVMSYALRLKNNILTDIGNFGTDPSGSTSGFPYYFQGYVSLLYLTDANGEPQIPEHIDGAKIHLGPVIDITSEIWERNGKQYVTVVYLTGVENGGYGEFENVNTSSCIQKLKTFLINQNGTLTEKDSKVVSTNYNYTSNQVNGYFSYPGNPVFVNDINYIKDKDILLIATKPRERDLNLAWDDNGTSATVKLNYYSEARSFLATNMHSTSSLDPANSVDFFIYRLNNNSLETNAGSWIGFSNDTVGQNRNVGIYDKNIENVVTLNQSDLVVGTRYYLNYDGTLTDTESSGTSAFDFNDRTYGEVGIAVSSNQIKTAQSADYKFPYLLTSPTARDILIYDSSLQKFVNKPMSLKSEGGIIFETSTHYYHVFKESGTFVLYEDKAIDYMILAGGGGGGMGAHAGGGGAGGLLLDLSGTSVLSSGEYPVVVGAGGSGSTNTSDKGVNGSDSSFNNLIAIGGGAGGSDNNTYGNVGGSGGGSADHSNNTRVSGTSGQGNSAGANYGTPGGQASMTTRLWDTGGGGAGGAGGNGYWFGTTQDANYIATYKVGYGGIGLSHDRQAATTQLSNITSFDNFLSAVELGILDSSTFTQSYSALSFRHIAGGGGAANPFGPTLGGAGGGGNGSGVNTADPSSGVDYTGSGGGGGWSGGGNGGHGVVVLRWTKPNS